MRPVSFSWTNAYRGAKCTVENKSGWSAIHLAAQKKHVGVVRYLLQMSGALITLSTNVLSSQRRLNDARTTAAISSGSSATSMETLDQ